MPRSLMFYLIAGAVVAIAAYQYFFDQDDEPSSSSQTYKPSQPPFPRRDERQRIDTSHRYHEEALPTKARQASQRPIPRRDEQQRIDTIHITPEEAYKSFRAMARQEGDLMSRCSQQSKEAYGHRDHARAKALSEEAKRHRLNMERLDAKASATIFNEHNRGRDTCEVDLHGLYVEEAVTYSQQAVLNARRGGHSEIRFIVGQGNHSEGGIPRLKPALQQAMQNRGHRIEVDPKNPGVLIAQLGGR